MTRKIKSLVMTVTLLSTLPVTAIAELSKHDQDKIVKICKEAIEKEGFGDFTYKFFDVLRAQSGNYGMSGQLHKDSRRYEFNCVLNKEIGSLKIKDLVINGLD